ncbi:MAG: LCP family protein [Oscillochloridaceae bacterium umkhey_bin13]
MDRPEHQPAYTDETVVLRRARPAASRPPRGRTWARVRLILLVGLGLALLVLGLIYWQVRSLASAITVDDVRPNSGLASPLAGANVLIIGTDERPGRPDEGIRSDTLILARLDGTGRWVSLLSIPRDTQVALPEVGLAQTKINAAYGQGYAAAQQLYGPATTPQQGGMALTAQTVERLLDLPNRGMRVDFVATVNFAGFADLIDALGGITVDVPRYLRDDAYPTADYGTMVVEFQPGPQQMDGSTALIYARTRHPDSDFGRAERQQQVVRAMISALQAKGLLGQALALPALAQAIDVPAEGGRPVLTTMPLDRPDVLLGLLGLTSGLDPDLIGQHGLGPAQLAGTNGSNLIFDPVAVGAVLDQWQRPPGAANEVATVQVFNGAGVDGLARAVSLDLEQQGLRVLMPGTAPAQVERTRVYDQGGTPVTGRRLAQILKAELVRGAPPGISSEATLVVVLGPDAAP